jgi:hypothetical protein
VVVAVTAAGQTAVAAPAGPAALALAGIAPDDHVPVRENSAAAAARTTTGRVACMGLRLTTGRAA